MPSDQKPVTTDGPKTEIHPVRSRQGFRDIPILWVLLASLGLCVVAAVVVSAVS